MSNFINQNPVNREISINPTAVLMCKINTDGIIEYVNHSFSEVSGYEEFEIIGEPMDVLRHPEVPKIIYEVLHERLAKNESVRIIQKQLAKDGRYFWLLSEYESKLNEKGDFVAHYSHSVAAPEFAVHKIKSLYKILLKIEEKTGNTEVSKRYLIGFLEERNLNYNQFIDELCANQPEFEKQFQQQHTETQTSNFFQQKNPVQKQYPGLNSNSLNYNPNFDISRSSKKSKGKKKKSLLKKVFGK